MVSFTTVSEALASYEQWLGGWPDCSGGGDALGLSFSSFLQIQFHFRILLRLVVVSSKRAHLFWGRALLDYQKHTPAQVNDAPIFVYQARLIQELKHASSAPCV